MSDLLHTEYTLILISQDVLSKSNENTLLPFISKADVQTGGNFLQVVCVVLRVRCYFCYVVSVFTTNLNYLNLVFTTDYLLGSIDPTQE